MHDDRLLTKNFTSLVVIQAANFLLPLLTLPFIVRIIGPDKFGLINYLLAVQMWFILLINYGFDYSATRTLAQYPLDERLTNRLFWQVLYARLFLLLVSVLLFSFLYGLLPNLRTDPRVSLWTMAACFSFAISPNWLFLGKQELPKATLFTVVGKLIFCLLVLSLIKEKKDYWIYAASAAATQILAGLALFLYTLKHYRLSFVPVNWKRIKALLSGARMIFLMTLMMSFYVTVNTIMLGIFHSDTEVGYFTAAARIIAVMQTLTLVPLSQSLFPNIGSAFSRGKEEGLGRLRSYFPFVLLISFTGSLFLWLVAPLLIRILFGADFLQAVPLLRILAFIPFIAGISNYYGTQAALNLKKDKPVMQLVMLAVAVNLLLSLLLTPRWGATGTALCWLLTELFLLVAMLWLIRRNHISLISKQQFSLIKIRELLGMKSRIKQL